MGPRDAMARAMTVSPVGVCEAWFRRLRGDGERRRSRVFRRSADGTFEAAICSFIELNSAKLSCAVSLPNPSTVGCSELEQTAAELDLEQAELVRSASLSVEPSFPQSKKSTCYFESSDQQTACCYLGCRFPKLVIRSSDKASVRCCSDI